ncbi:hypothetical protein NT07LI_3929 [Listeria innocua FSL S4-378]|nr:hypothetical protein NT07LI_3929 [Listeria innocua FSL S4-378]
MKNGRIWDEKFIKKEEAMDSLSNAFSVDWDTFIRASRLCT